MLVPDATADPAARDGGLDSAVLRKAFGCYPSGVTAVCALIGGVPCGMSVSSFMCVSLEPPLVSVSVQNTSRTWPVLRQASTLGVSVLGQDHGGLCRALAGPAADRFTGTAWADTPQGAVFVEGSAAAFTCVVEAEHVAGDHTIVVLRVLGLQADPAVEPLVFHTSTFRTLRGD